MEKENKHEEFDRECERKRSGEDACDVDTFCWPISQRSKHDFCQFSTYVLRRKGRRMERCHVCRAVLWLLLT